MEISSISYAEPSSVEKLDKKFWQAHVKQLNESGLTKSEYARVNNLSYSNFLYWCRKTGSLSKRKTTLIAVKLKSSIQEPVCQPVSEILCKLHFRNGSHLSIHDLQTLSFILERMN